MAEMNCADCKVLRECPDAFKAASIHCGNYRTAEKSDNVHHPKHYETHIDGLETIDVIYAALGPEKFEGYCRGNVIKYLLRADQKGGTEDLQKAAVYLGWAIDVREGRGRK